MNRPPPIHRGLALCVFAGLLAAGSAQGTGAGASFAAIAGPGFLAGERVPSTGPGLLAEERVPIADSEQRPLSRRELFGFEVGEERIYVMGPPETLAAGEMATWVIRLDRLEGDGKSLRAVFGLQHERKAPHSRDYLPTSGSFRIAQVHGELVVNSYGVPLELSYVSQRYVLDVGEEVFEIVYELDGKRYKKKVRVDGGDWDLRVDITEHPGLDLKVPEGLFVAAPSSIACLEWGITGEANAEACNELNIDPTFANPGLLSLLLPALREVGGSSEVLLFTPTRPDLVPGDGGGIPIQIVPIVPGIPNVPGSPIFSGGIPGLDWGKFMIGGSKTAGDRDRATNPTRYFQPSQMQVLGHSRVQVGPRTVEALELRMSTYPYAAWIDDQGRVLRVDITGDVPEEERRWLRLLYPSEY